MIRKEAQTLSPWRQLLSGVKEKYPFKEDLVYQSGKWASMEEGCVQCLSKLDVLEVICGDQYNDQISKDTGEVKYTTRCVSLYSMHHCCTPIHWP